MRFIKCDVCGENYTQLVDTIEMIIPASFLDEEGEGIAIDVCSWSCVSAVVDSALNKGEEDPEPEQVVEIPTTPHVDEKMTEKLLAEYTEAVTGVRRR